MSQTKNKKQKNKSTKRVQSQNYLMQSFAQISNNQRQLDNDQLYLMQRSINQEQLNLIQLLDEIIKVVMSTNKGKYGFISGFIAAATLQPLQNVKMVLLVPPSDAKFTPNFIKNISIAFRYLYQDGKLKAFYRGITANVLRTGFSSSIYFSMLRYCEDFYSQFPFFHDSMAKSFLSSLTARVISSISSNPLSVLETRYQYAGHERWSGSLLKNLAKIYQYEGLKGFFQGGLTTCYKEGAFAGLYYMLYQEGKSFGINNFVAGFLSGMIATSLTHPFEIVRAEIQSFILTKHSISNLGIFKQIQTLIKTGQAFRGLAPRIIKKPLTNTMAFCIFELLQSMDIKNND